MEDDVVASTDQLSNPPLTLESVVEMERERDLSFHKVGYRPALLIQQYIGGAHASNFIFFECTMPLECPSKAYMWYRHGLLVFCSKAARASSIPSLTRAREARSVHNCGLPDVPAGSQLSRNLRALSARDIALRFPEQLRFRLVHRETQQGHTPTTLVFDPQSSTPLPFARYFPAPPPAHENLQNFAFLSVFLEMRRKKSPQSPKFSKSAPPEENGQKIDLVNIESSVICGYNRYFPR